MMGALFALHALLFLPAPAQAPPSESLTLRIHPEYPHYFQGPDRKPLLLIGDYTWGTFSDADFDYKAQLDALAARGLNFARIWLWWGCEELPAPDNKLHIEPFLRPGPGTANDGRPKYDLTRFHPAFFDRLRDLCAAARERGIYLQLITVDAWMLKHSHLWKLHAFHRDNNSNGVDGDPRSTGTGTDGRQGFCSLGNPQALEFQKAYLRKLLDSVNDFDNILLEIANENYYGDEWERRLCEFLRECERDKPRQHVLMPLDLLSHSNVVQKWDPKVIHAALIEKRRLRQPLIFDTDWIINNDDGAIRRSMWAAVLSGGHFNYMDDSLEFRGRPAPDRRAKLHAQIGHLAGFMKLLRPWEMRPGDALVQSGYALAMASTEVLAAYLPAGGKVTLDLTPLEGALEARWFDPLEGTWGGKLTAQGGAPQELSAPNANDWALLLRSGSTSEPPGAGAPARVVAIAPDPLYLYDLSWTLKLDRSDPAALRRAWDTCHLVAALQGLANREGPRLYLRYLDVDDFWLRLLREEDPWLRDRKLVELESVEELLATFRSSYRGAVVWDEKSPATSNVASTVCGAEDLLPLRYDPEGLFGNLVSGDRPLEVKVWLVRPDGESLFTGKGTIPGSELPSLGSRKADAYAWADLGYLKSGKSSAEKLSYSIDGYWLRAPFACGPDQHTLSNHDYFIAHRAFFFDLSPWEDEPPVDDPGQPLGTDVRILKEILLDAHRRRRGKGMLHIGGFVPWAFKYTDHPGAGGRRAGVPTEWRFAEIVSCFDAFLDADAIGLAAMANASFFQHYPYRPPELPARSPSGSDLRRRGFLSADGKVVPAPYVAFYAGDWDSAAWVYRRMPDLWRDPNRGRVPLGWAVNPNLEDRMRPALAWLLRTATENDVFIAGDSGAGYLNPGFLEEPRVHSGLPGGLAAWAEHCERYYRRWGLTVTGFVIDGNARGLSEKGLEAYARFSPGGIVAQKCPLTGLHGEMPIVRASGDLSGPPEEAARHILDRTRGRRPSFLVFRSILQSPTWHLKVVEEVLRSDPGVRFVDPATLLALVKVQEKDRENQAAAAAGLKEISFAAGAGDPLISPVSWEDGLFREAEVAGFKALEIDGSRSMRYLYFDVPAKWGQPPAHAAGAGLEVSVTYLDRGKGAFVLEYDSRDPSAPVGGAYKASRTVEVTGSGEWRETRFRLPDARFESSQNGGADFRIASPPAGLVVRQVKVRRD